MGRTPIGDGGGGGDGGAGGGGGVSPVDTLALVGAGFRVGDVKINPGAGVAFDIYSEAQLVVVRAPRAPQVCYKSADEVFTLTTFADVASLSVPLEANASYGFRFHLPYLTSDATEACFLSLNGPASPSYLSYFTRIYTAAAVLTEYPRTAYDSASGNTVGTLTEKSAVIEGSVENGANAGNLVVRAACETGAGKTVTVRRGSFGLVWKLS